jgi:nicotinamidase-related amidase
MKRKLISVLVILVSLQVMVLSQDMNANEPGPDRPALVIIDIQNQFLPMVPEQEKGMALYFINEYISLFREKGLPVIRVYHTSPDWGPHPDSLGFQYPESIRILPDDPMIIKNFPSSFKKTDLDKMLKEMNCNTVFLCGLSAVACVISTYFSAKDLDYNAFLLKNAIMSHNSTYTQNIEIMFEAVGYDAVEYILDQTGQ